MGMNPLESLAKVVASPKESAALQAIIAANPVTISFDPNCPNKAVRTDNGQGLKQHGWVDEAGVFHAVAE